jgi:primary-amine oxidase
MSTRLIHTDHVVFYDFVVGSLHDHVINFKVDLDIVGTSNSLLSTTTSREEIEQPWLATNSDSTFDYEDDWGTTVIQQKIHKKYIENEDEAMLEYPHNFQGGYAIVNREESNKWGVPRGYAVHQGYNPVHNVSAFVFLCVELREKKETDL